MGDRANIVIRSSYKGRNNCPDVGTHEAVFLYGHWSGFDLPDNLRTALLAGVNRWDDASYLARILFDQALTRDPCSTTGFGISTRLTDNEYSLLVLLPEEKRLVVLAEKDYWQDGFTTLDDNPSISFGDYVEAPQRTWDNLTDPSPQTASFMDALDGESS